MVSNRASTEALATEQMIPSGTEVHQQWYRPSGSNQTMILILVRTTRVSGITFFRYARINFVTKACNLKLIYDFYSNFLLMDNPLEQLI